LNKILYETTLPCFLAWTRRNPIPPHPNIHTDVESARAAGFETIIMSASQIVPHLYQALIEVVGVEKFFSGLKVSYKMVRPVTVPGIARVIIEASEHPGTMTVRIEDAENNLCIVGTANPV
jgi:acyl dehydratase